MQAETQSSQLDSNQTTAILLFDGVCNLCNGFVNFVIDNDPKAYFRFAALQSEPGKALLDQFHLPQVIDTIVLIERGRSYTQSTAALRAMKSLQAPVSFLYYFILVPQPIRDFIYRRVANNRYRLMGKRDACRMPTPDLRTRFLEDI